MAAVALVLLGLAQPPAPDIDLYSGVTGGADAFPQNRNPGWILGHKPVQRLMVALASRPFSVEQIDAALAGTGVAREDLEAIQMIRRRRGEYVINFARSRSR